MSINSALLIALSGIETVNSALAVVANNVSNQDTTAYATEVSNQSEISSGGVGMGVVSTATTRDINTALQASVFNQNATVSYLTTQSTALNAIDDVSGTTGTGDNLPDLLSDLEDSFTTLSSDPDSESDQAAVVDSAESLASGINSVASEITEQRQTAQDDIVSDVATLNTALAQIGQLNTQITTAQAAGESTADLENQRDIAEQTISNLTDAQFVTQSNGAVLVMTSSGVQLPTDGTQITTSSATIAATSSYPTDIPGIMLNGADITSAFQSGSLGAAINLRDTVLPQRQAELDEFSEQLASRFSAQGLTLFSNSSGTVPTTGTPTQSNYVGFSSEIQVNPAVSSDAALVVNGTQDITGSSTGASAFTTNSAGTADFTTLIQRVLDYTFGSDVQAGVAQPSIPSSGLGVNGTIDLDYTPGDDLTDFVAAMAGSDATQTASVSSSLTSATDTQTALNDQLSSQSAVSVDTQMADMVQLQNSYSANAKVLTTVQALYTQLFDAIS